MRNSWLVSALLLVACNQPSASESTTQATPQPAGPVGTQPAPASQNAPSSQPAGAALPAPTGAPSAGGLTWDAAAPFVRRAPKSRMRSEEYGLEGVETAELAVFYFGPDSGGMVEPNITRWLGQLTQSDGSDTAQKAKRSEIKAGDIPVTLVEATGTYSGGMGMPGAAAPAPQPDSMLLGAIATGPKGAVFFKLVGPRAGVEKAQPAFRALVSSVRVEAAQ